MDTSPQVLLSAFGDEASKRVDVQFAVLQAIGLNYVSLRFLDFGDTAAPLVEHIMKIDRGKRERLKRALGKAALAVAEIGSPIGKTKIVNEDDGTKNAFKTIDEVLADVEHAIGLCEEFGTRMIRGFPFYHPKGKPAAGYVGKSVEWLGRIEERCRAANIVFGLEIEANLVGENGSVMADIARQVDGGNLVTIWDGANVACRAIRDSALREHFTAMLPSLGWAHVKDYQIPAGMVDTGGHLDEEALKNFVPAAANGDAEYPWVLSELRKNFAAISARLTKLGLPGLFLTLEPHLKGGGQFGGKSGPDGLGLALRVLCGLLNALQIGYKLRTLADVKQLPDE